MNLGETAQRAAHLVSKERQEEYGDPEQVFGCAANIATLLTGVSHTVHDVILVMIAVKLAREKEAHKADNLIDLAGYADILNYIRERQNV